MTSLKRLRWFLTLSLALLLLVGCPPDDDPDPATDTGLQDVEDADSEDADSEELASEICPEDGSFDYIDPGSCILQGQDQSASNCPASSMCGAGAHCVGQGGADGPPEDCRTLNCGVIDCASECECVAQSICECPEE